MSKYNLIDIYEQYQIGSGWTNDFDYDGMLNTGLGTSIDTPIEVLKKMSDDFEDVNYHRENSHLQDAIDAIEIGDMMEAEGRLSDFHAEIRKTMEEFGMDISDDLGAYMASKMDLEEGDAVDLAIEASQEKAGIEVDESFKSLAKKVDKQKGVDKEYAGKIAGKIANIKRKGGGSGPTAKQKKRMNEVSSRVGSRIEGLLNIPMKQKFLDAGMDLIQDLLEDDQFFIPDVIEHLAIELEKYYDGFLDQGDKLAGMDQQEFTAIDEKDAFNFDMKADADYDEGLEDIEEALPKFKGVPEKPSIIRALKVDGNGTKMEIDSYMASLKRSGDEFDDVDDYVEDFKNYVADKALQEHFGRFMKDYQ